MAGKGLDVTGAFMPVETRWFVVERHAEALEMAGKGKEFDFHGCYRDKSDAITKEKEVGGFIRERVVLGRKCYLVLTAKKK